MTIRSHLIAPTSSSTGSTGLAVGALVTAGAGALFGLGAFLAVVVGDEMIPFDVVAVVAAILAAVGLVAAALVGSAPGAAAVGMATVSIGYVIVLGGSFGSWWAKYQTAIATSGAAENAFWTAMPAMGLFAVSGVLIAVGAVLAALRWDDTAEGLTPI